MKFRYIAVPALLACASFSLFAQGQGNGAPEIISHRINPNGAAGTPTVGSTGVITPAISFHGGSVIGTPIMYIIWYGNWNQSNGTDNSLGQDIVRNFATNIGGSPYFAINKTYNTTTQISGNVTFGGETTVGYTHGTRLKDNDILSIVTDALAAGTLPSNVSGVYFVLTSSDVAEQSGFCTRYCGWHTKSTTTGFGNIRYSFVGNAARCLNACAEQTVGPNNNAGVDGMVSVIAHELEEATTDPDLNAWYDSKGAENADKCAWTFGDSQPAGNGSYFNMTLGNRPYLIQRNLKHGASADYCVLQ